MLSGTAGEQIPDGGHRPKHCRPDDDVAILPVGDIGGRTYEELYVEHAPVARRVALSMVPRDVADDIVAEAFTRVLGAIRAGGGPGLAFRAYLLTAVRNTANDWLRASRRTTVLGDLDQDLEDHIPEENMGLARLSRGPEAEAEAHAEARLVAGAFARLPARWRAVLWQLEVEGKAPAAIAPMFGLSANGLSELAVRAREGLRQAYLQQHIGRNVPASCRSYAAALGADARGRLSRRRRSAVHEHLQHCARCHALANELTELNSRFGAILTPAALAGASAALASGGGALSTGTGAGIAEAGAVKAGTTGAGTASGIRTGVGTRAGTSARAATGMKAGAGARAATGGKAGAGIKTAVTQKGARLWLAGHWRLLRLHPVTVAAGAAAGLAAAGGMVFAVSVTPASPSPQAAGAGRVAVPAAALSSPGPFGHLGRPGAASPLGSAAALAPAGGVTGGVCPGTAAGTSAPNGTGGGCGGAASAGPAGQGKGTPAAPGTGVTGPSAGHTTASGGTAGPSTGPIRQIASGVRSGLGTTVGNLGPVVAGATQAAGTVLGPTVSSLGNAVSGTTQQLGAGLSSSALSGADNAVTSVGNGAAATVRGLGGTVSSTTGSVGNVVGSLTQGVGGLVGGTH